MREAAAQGLDRAEAIRALATFVEEFPEMTEPEICALIIEKFVANPFVTTRPTDLYQRASR